MSNKKITELAAATPLGVGDLFEISQGGVNKKLTGAQLLVFVADGSGIVVLDTSTTEVGTVGTGEDTLFSYTLPAGTLAADGNSIRGRMSGIVGNNANVKSIKLKFGGTTFLTRGTTTPTIGQGWTIDWEVIRTGAAAQKCNATFSGSDGTASAYYSVAGETLSGTVAIVLTGEATDNDDIIKHTSKIVFEP